MKRFDGKVVLVTGGTRGIGAAIVRSFASEGAKVSFLGRNEKLGQDIMRELNPGDRQDVVYVKGDMAVKGDLEDWARSTEDNFGKMDVLVNNAGIFPATPFLDIKEDEMDMVFAVNQRGTFLCSQIVARRMASGNGGSIINISSVQGLIGLGLQAHYSATKGAMNALTRALTAELGPIGIRVNAIAPGLTTTEAAYGNFPPEIFEGVTEQTPLKYLVTAEDVAACALFLASDDAKSISGVIIPMDGGFSSCH